MTTNADRVNNAEAAIQAYLKRPGVDEDSFFTDLLTDLMHWHNDQRRPYGYSSFEDDLSRARGHYEAEK